MNLKGYKLCKHCGCPILKKGKVRKNLNEYRHAQGCPEDDICNKADERRSKAGGYSARCVKPKGHEGNHKDSYGCWWH